MQILYAVGRTPWSAALSGSENLQKTGPTSSFITFKSYTLLQIHFRPSFAGLDPEAKQVYGNGIVTLIADKNV